MTDRIDAIIAIDDAYMPPANASIAAAEHRKTSYSIRVELPKMRADLLRLAEALKHEARGFGILAGEIRHRAKTATPTELAASGIVPPDIHDHAFDILERRENLSADDYPAAVTQLLNRRVDMFSKSVMATEGVALSIDQLTKLLTDALGELCPA